MSELAGCVGLAVDGLAGGLGRARAGLRGRDEQSRTGSSWRDWGPATSLRAAPTLPQDARSGSRVVVGLGARGEGCGGE